MKITDVIDLFEAELAFGASGSKAMGTANFGLLSRYYTRPSQRMQPTLTLNFGSDNVVKLTGDDVEAIAKYYDNLPADADRYDFVYDTMSRADKFNALLTRLGRREPPAPPLAPIPTANQTAMDLSERDQKTEPDLSRGGVRSAALSTALRQAYAKYPQARSDIEALLMHDMDTQKDTSQELKSQSRTNQRQDDIDIQLRDVNRKQSNKISNLDQENDNLSAELDKLSRELDAMHRQTGTAPERQKDSAKKSDSDTGSSNYGVNVSADGRAEKSQQRSAGAKKRKPEPARLKPGSVKPSKPPVNIGAVPPVTPTAPAMAAPAAMPTIDVIDQSTSSPVMGQMAQSLTNPPAKDSITDPMAPPTQLGSPELDQDPDSAYSAARSAEDEPDNVFQFPGSKKEIPAGANQGSFDFDVPDELARQRQTLDQLRRSGSADARNAIRDNRTAAMLEAQQLRRMKELAGLPVNEADSWYTPPVPGVFAIRVNAQFINDYSPSYRPENPEILWNGLSTAFPRDYPRVKFGVPNCPQADVFAELKDRSIADVKTGLTQDMAETLAERLGKSDPTGQLSRFIQVIQKRPQSYENKTNH